MNVLTNLQIQAIKEACNKGLENIFSSIQSSGDSVIERFKKGNKIHIKKKNRGSFTRWCGGNVTEECIRRGKASSNPAIRKKATFAQNVRRWHKN